MEIHVQRCQHCKSDKMKNVLYRELGEPDRVYVQCQDCGHFVASYILAPMGYYHHEKGYESFLRSMHRTGEFMSGRNLTRIYERRVEKETEMFEDALKKLAERDARRARKKAEEEAKKNGEDKE